jgi:Methyltransferase domain
MTTEGRWTPPSEWCEYPNRWHSDTSDATEWEVTELVAAFVRALQPDLVVETGTNTGQTAFAIGTALVRNGHGRLDTLEPDGDLWAEAKAQCNGLPVNCILGSSLDYIPPVRTPIGFGWFDSLPNLRHQEILRFLPDFAPGAIIGIHDTGPQHVVWGTLQPLIQGGHLTAMNLHTPRGSVLSRLTYSGS